MCVEHQSIVNLLKILEDAQCPDCMLQKVLQWVYNAAKLKGFDFDPKATARKANKHPVDVRSFEARIPATP
jgi:hypothetical protein